MEAKACLQLRALGAGSHAPFAVLVLAAIAAWQLPRGGCSSLTLPTLPAQPKQPAPAADGAGQPADPTPIETAFIVPGTPTASYAIVARGALNCWLGAAGPLHATHVFAAEAAPPNQGGAAEIVLHERDPTFRDQRGPRALRVSFEQAQGGVRVGFEQSAPRRGAGRGHGGRCRRMGKRRERMPCAGACARQAGWTTVPPPNSAGGGRR